MRASGARREAFTLLHILSLGLRSGSSCICSGEDAVRFFIKAILDEGYPPAIEVRLVMDHCFPGGIAHVVDGEDAITRGFAAARQLGELGSFRFRQSDSISVGHAAAQARSLSLTIRNMICYVMLKRFKSIP